MNKLDLKTIGLITTFEKITRSHVKNVLLDKVNQVVFIVNEGEAGKAIGKGGVNIKKLSFLLKKKIRVIEFNPDMKEFIKNCIAPLKVDAIQIEEKKVVLRAKSRQIRAQIIGRDKTNLKELNQLLKKYFDTEISVE
tara:strand:+ start:26392 stop:26802 length:411 start_codon:yes stop_codon:yes gene_type:complete